jgi:hypothetical protein
MSPVGLELVIPASERPQTQALDSAATRISFFTVIATVIVIIMKTTTTTTTTTPWGKSENFCLSLSRLPHGFP